MPKPRTKGPTIQFRLPLPTHANLQTIADELDTSIHELAAALTELGVNEHEVVKGQLVRPSIKPVTEPANPDRPGYRQIHR